MSATSYPPHLYRSSGYAQSFGEWMHPVDLPRAGGYLLARQWQALGWDLMAPYPLLSLRKWQYLSTDLANLGESYTSLVAVVDPLADTTPEQLSSTFSDLCRPFKQHHLVDLQAEPTRHFSSHHRRYAKAAAKAVHVEELSIPCDYLDDWCALYDILIQRHEIGGLTRFSRASFSVLLSLPGCRAFAARSHASGQIVGMILMADAEGDTHYHLGAYNAEGYASKASFALFATIINQYARKGYRYLNLGGGAGFRDDPEDGLARFKQGWASFSRPTYLVGKILHRPRYQLWQNSADALESGFFPAYRDPSLVKNSQPAPVHA
ncbi:MAG: hypothetical protein E1N59_126 [Puniceicoccaceae bacterium 5H]|nr:MAG: hypothetical protein E1N59_126 [Puniceicoccaceae bacterium 5H]